MAARESQGLQIALIVFVMLSILLSVTTFIFFRNYQEEKLRSAAASETARKDGDALRAVQGERNDLMVVVGFPATESDTAKVIGEARKELDGFVAIGGINLPEDQRNYRKVLEGLAATVRTKNESLAVADDHNKQLESEKAALLVETEKKIAQHEAGMKQAVDDLAAERKKFNDDLAALTKTKEQLEADKNSKGADLEKQKSAYDKQVNELSSQIAKLTELSTTLKKQNDELVEVTFDVPDGKISWVNQREGMVFLNLGSDDGLRKRISFSVFAPDASDIGNSQYKGKIEVVEVTDRHVSMARIIEDEPGDPLLPGDVVFTPVWHPGKQEHFALTGFIDIDNDQVSDLRKVIDLIELNGGVVDSYLDDEGKVVGTMSINTRYLVDGGNPNEVASQVSLVPGYNAIVGDAAKLTIQKISLSKFLDLMGYTPGTAIGGSEPDADEAQPAEKPGATTFRPRRPPARGKSGGAF